MRLDLYMQDDRVDKLGYDVFSGNTET